MKLTQMLILAGLLGTLTAPGMLYAHCGHCGKGEGIEGKAGADGQDPMDKMAKELKLSEDQKAKIKAIKEDMHKQMEALHQDTHTKVNAVLTKDQQAKHEKMVGESCEMCKKHKHTKGETH